ncbi:MAG: hypothetical protein M1827_004267 [Pycnora praestabilis]|nr:MAG: hypothetical protein M1827_004267 [Pycnora praestabilis]
MRFSLLYGPTAAEFASILNSWLLLFAIAPSTLAISFDPVPSPNLDLSQLGRVALAGDFDSISLYSYEEQNENGFSTNGSQSILTRFPNGAFATLASSDASIQAMCPFVMKDGTLAGVVVGGNFTSLGGVEAQGIALFNPNTTTITPLPGLSGQVNAVLCDQTDSTVYVGGDFKGANSTNAIAWVGTQGWTNLPFAGFNGPVNSIVQAPDGNVVFGGSFDGLGNTTTPSKKDMQIINISGANVSAGSTTSTAGFNDPNNIVCKTGGQDGTGNTWLLSDNSPGFWRADFQFGFEPTKMRIWNTHQDGRGTKTFRYTAFPINGIMNFTYTDPATGLNASCDARCPLSDNSSVPYQDFRFVNVIGMSAFQIDISEWYGSGGGLDGIELFQDDIYAYAINKFNEPACANIDLGSNATSTGPWVTTPSGQSSSQYLTADLTGPNINSGSASVVFEPDLNQSGNYTVTIFTPGCLQDNTCSSRGIVNITGTMASGTTSAAPIQTEIYQTNNYDKYDQIYYGYVDSNSDAFRPTVTLTPSSGQNSNVTIVAQRVRFELIASNGGLNGLYEYDPNQAMVSSDFSNSSFDQAGVNLNTDATVNQLAVANGVTYVGGNFTTSSFENIFAISNGNSTSLPGGGLNAEVSAMFLNGTLLYVGGNFTNTSSTDTEGLSNIAAFSISNNTWQALGAGVNGRVNAIVPLTLNVTNDQPQLCITVNGDFDQILAFGSFKSASVEGLAVWVPSQNNWLQNLNDQSISISGQLTAQTDVPGASPVFAGTVSSQGLSISDVASLPISGSLSINQFPLKIQPQQLQQSSKRKRAVSGQNVTGAVTGYFYETSTLNITIIGGHFTATGSNGSNINNLVFVNGSNNDAVTGVGDALDADAVFLALGVQGTVLYAGGTLTGTVEGAEVNGLILYDLEAANYVPTQPPAFSGSDVAVNAVATRPNTAEVYIGGNFDSAGSLSCPSVCYYSGSQWNRPGTNLGGSVAALTWSNNNKLVAGGNLTVNDEATSVATYDTNAKTWSVLAGNDSIPGPVTALTAANDQASEFWVAGLGTNGSAFLMKYDGTNWHTVGDTLGKSTTIRGLQVLSLSQDHAQNDLVPQGQTLVITGQLDLPSFGNASAALFNGTTFSPFILSTTANNNPGSLSQIFSAKQNYFSSSGSHLKVIFVVLIALAIALALIFILVTIGIIAERLRRKREGYMPAPTQMFDKNSNMERIPPSHLFHSMGQQGRSSRRAPMI